MALKLRDFTRWSEAPAKDVETASTPKVNLLRGLAARATTPLLPDDYLKLLNPLWSARELRGEVVDVRKETEDSATVTIKPAPQKRIQVHQGSFAESRISGSPICSFFQVIMVWMRVCPEGWS